MGKLVLNVKTTLMPPLMTMTVDELMDDIKIFLNSRGFIQDVMDDKTIIYTSFRFNKIKHVMYFHIDVDNTNSTIKSVEILLRSLLYRKRLSWAMEFYETLLSGLFEYLNDKQWGWVRDVTVVRIRPIDFLKQFKSRVSDTVSRFITTIELADGSVYTLYPDRIECSVDTLTETNINAIFEVIRRYSRK